MSRAGTPANTGTGNTPQQPAPVQFQFQHPIQYPMSQAQQNQASQPAAGPSSQSTTPAPLTQMSSIATLPASTQASSTASQSQVTAAITAPAPSQTRMAAEQARKDRTLTDFMLLLDDYEPLIPSEVTDYYLQRVGFETDDVRLKRLLALAAQKFVSDIAADAYQHARIRTNAAPGGRGRAPMGQSARDKTRTTLTMEDLSAALSEYGINARKPDFYM